MLMMIVFGGLSSMANECNNCYALEANSEILNEHIEKFKGYDKEIARLQDEIKTLKQLCKHYETTIERQGKEVLRRHDFLCEIKETLDNYFGE